MTYSEAKYLELNVKWSILKVGKANLCAKPGGGKVQFLGLWVKYFSSSPPFHPSSSSYSLRLIDWIMINRARGKTMDSGRVGGLRATSGCLMDKTGPESPTQITRPSTGQAGSIVRLEGVRLNLFPNNQVCVWGAALERCEEGLGSTFQG